MTSLKRMRSFVRPYTLVSIFLVITVVLPVVMELTVPRVLGYVIDQGIIPGDMQAILRGTALLLAVAFAGAIATLGQGVCRALLSQGLAYDMRNDLFSHIHSLSFADLDHMQTGQLMTRISSDVDLVRMFVGNGLALVLRALLMIFGSVLLMFVIDWQLALVMLLLLPLAAAAHLGRHAHGPTPIHYRPANAIRPEHHRARKPGRRASRQSFRARTLRNRPFP